MSQLVQELDILLSFNRQAQNLSEETPQESKQALIQIRKGLILCLSRISNCLRDNARLKTNPQLDGDAHRRLSKVRHIVALHQSEWPAVDWEPRSKEYSLSARRVVEAVQEFTAWARTEIG